MPASIRVYGEKGGLEWSQMEPNTLIVRWLDRPSEILRAGANFENLSSYALANLRTPAGHPEGYLEAFANIYMNFVSTLRAKMDGKEPSPEHDIQFNFPVGLLTILGDDHIIIWAA